MRLFVAVPVPGELRERAAALGKELPRDGITPVRPENMHLTLRFIGEVGENEAGEIEKALEGVGFEPFECELKGVGVFPNENYVKVVWAGCESGGKLEALAKAVADALRGHPGDDRFSAHLTIARVKRKVDLHDFLERHRADDIGTFTVSEFALVKSVLSPSGPEYATLAHFRARGE